MIGFDIDFKVLWDNDEEGQRSLKLATEHFGTEISNRHFSLLPSPGGKGKRILQNLFDGNDIKMVKESLKLNDDAQFNKVIIALFYSEKRKDIVGKISIKTKENFKDVLRYLQFE